MFVDCSGTILSRSENCGAANVRADTADEPQRHTQRMTVEDLRKAADSCHDLEDPTLMARASDEPATVDMQLATSSPRKFG